MLQDMKRRLGSGKIKDIWVDETAGEVDPNSDSIKPEWVLA